MSEFTLHHRVSELMNRLGVSSSDPIGKEEYTELLSKSITPYVTTLSSSSQAKKRIGESTDTPVEFLAKFDELKGKKVRNLDAFVDLLDRISDDGQSKGLLTKQAFERAKKDRMVLTSHKKITSELPEPGTQMTQEELSQVKDFLLKNAKKIDNPQADFFAKIQRDKHYKRNVNLPQQPDWLFQRDYLSMDFIRSMDIISDGNLALGSLPVLSQEYAVLLDLLHCMMGVSGKYIIAQPLKDRYANQEFLIDQSLDVSIQELVNRILPVCSNFSTVTRFIEEKVSFEYGLVNHALSAAMDSLMKEHHILIAQLEAQIKCGQLSLQKLHFYLQPSSRLFEILASVVNSVNRGKCIGGDVLSLLHEKTASMIGDSKSSELCLYLTQSACVPYFEILEKWIYRGAIQDPYAEFMVEENEKIQKEKLQKEYNDSYWEKHYTVFQERIPVFLERLADKILNTGKYLNVVRQCGRDVKCPFAEELVYSVKERRYFDQIEKAYQYASQLLLTLLIEEKELMARLKSIKHYFLLDKGDFIVQFMDMTELEMKQNIDDIQTSRLESLLELALRTSTANVDPFKDDLKIDLLPYDLTSQLLYILAIESKQEREYRIDPTDIRLSGLESFTFDYVVKWPTSLVLSRKALTRYQILFRHLFYCKHVERQLNSVWMVNKQTKMFTRWYFSAFALRQRMLNFVQNFEYYMMFEVIEPNWHVFQENMAKVTTLDDVLAFHADFLDSCLKDCMLTHTALLRIVDKLLVVCVTFSNYVQRVSKAASMDTETERLRDSSLQSTMSNKERKEDAEKKKTATRVVSEHVDQQLADENFEQTIQMFDHNFSRHLLELLDRIMDESKEAHYSKLINIIHRLNFNGFYTDQLESMSGEKIMKENTILSETGSSSSSSSLTSFTSQQPEAARYVPGHYKASSSRRSTRDNVE